MGFHTIVMTISIVILVFALILIGITMYRQTHNDVTFPPVIAECPDYWKNISTDGKIICDNVKNLGSCPGTKDFSASEFLGNSGLCGKQKWAKSCGVVWDGVTNNNRLCE